MTVVMIPVRCASSEDPKIDAMYGLSAQNGSHHKRIKNTPIRKRSGLIGSVVVSCCVIYVSLHQFDSFLRITRLGMGVHPAVSLQLQKNTHVF